MIEFVFGVLGFLLVVVGLIFAARTVDSTAYNADGSLKKINEDPKPGAKVHTRSTRLKRFHFLITLGVGCLLVALVVQAYHVFYGEAQCAAALNSVKSLTDKAALQALAVKLALVCDVVGFIFVLMTFLFGNTKSAWGGIGGLLIIIAMGNLAILLAVELNPTQHMASLFGSVVLGALGTRFLGN